MSDKIAMSLDDLINADRAAKGGGKGGAMRKSGGRGARDRSAPYSRGSGGGERAKPAGDEMERRGRGTFKFGGGSGGKAADGNVSSKNVYVGNLAWSVDWRELKDYMKEAGDIVRVDIATRSDGKSRGFAIVQFGSAKAAAAAIATFNETEYSGRTIMVRPDNGESQVGGDGGAPRRGKGGGGSTYAAVADGGEDDGYSNSGRTGRNGWVKPEVTSFVDDGPPAEPKSMLR